MTACGSSETEVNTSPSLSELSGVWNASDTYVHVEDGTQVTNEGELTASYMVIRESGTYTNYTYEITNYDQDAKCYKKLNGTITDLGSGKFRTSNGYTSTVLHATLTDNKIFFDSSDGTRTFSFSATWIEENDISPVCLIK